MNRILILAQALCTLIVFTACSSPSPTPTVTPLPLPTATPNPTATFTVTATSTSTISPTPTQTFTPTTIPITPSATPLAKGAFDGTWKGATSQGKSINFVIKNDTITFFSVDFDPKVCGASMFTNLEEQTLKDNTFEKIVKFGITPWFIIRGTIDIQGKMSGTLTAEKNTMCQPTRLEWIATR